LPPQNLQAFSSQVVALGDSENAIKQRSGTCLVSESEPVMFLKARRAFAQHRPIASTGAAISPNLK
jgi:hypothetical protein